MPASEHYKLKIEVQHKEGTCPFEEWITDSEYPFIVCYFFLFFSSYLSDKKRGSEGKRRGTQECKRANPSTHSATGELAKKGIQK